MEATLLAVSLLLLLLFSGPAALVLALSRRSSITRLEQDLGSLRLSTLGLEERIARIEATLPSPGAMQARREAKHRALREIVGAATTPETTPAPAPEKRPSPSSGIETAAPPRPTPSPEPAPEPSPASEPAAPPPPEPPGSQPSVARGSGWEHWLGVRGAAALGAVVLVLAGLYLFRFSIEKGLLTPALRVALGILTGIGCLLGAETVLRRRHALLANWIAGAGAAILYSSFWAAAARYGLIGLPVAAGSMVLVTATACLLAVRRSSLAIAILGLLGGFATPALLSTGADRPVALFSYLLVLDGALLLVARARRWPALGALSLLGTALYQWLWIAERMGPERLPLGIGILVVFAGLFAVLSRAPGEEAAPLWRLIRAAALLVPFSFAFYFGLSAEIAPSFVLTGCYLGLLVASAAWVARTEGRAWLEIAATSAALGATAAWLFTHPLDARGAWEVTGVAVGIGAVLLAFSEWRRSAAGSISIPIWTSVASVAIATAAAASPASSPWVPIAGWALLGAVALRHATKSGQGVLYVIAPLVVGLSFSVLDLGHAGETGFARPTQMLLASLALAVGFGLVALLPAQPEARRLQGHGAVLLALVLLAHQLLLTGSVTAPTAVLLGATLLMGLIACCAALRARTGVWMLAAVGLTALVQTPMIASLPVVDRHELQIAFAFEILAALLFSGWVFALPGRLREDRWFWRAAALAGPAFFTAMRLTFEKLGGKGVIALVPLGLAALSVGAVYGVRVRGPRAAEVRRSALAWLGATALGFVAVAAPLQLENEWLTIAWALQVTATLALWRRIDHVGLKLFAMALAAAVTVRLVLNPAVLDYHLRGPLPILNWLSYAYLVPAACLLGAWRLLGGAERERLRSWETQLLPERIQPWAARLSALFAIVIVFVWMNLAIIDLFSTGPELRVALEHVAARDLCMSVGWAAYSLALLALGVRRRSTGLRALSLGLMLVTCTKVFLYDLSHLEDLFRVASLVGLASSLIVVSLAYQRFVFGKQEAPG